MEIKTFYERNLPHIVPIGSSLFITPRLAGSIPKQLADQWKQERKAATDAARRALKNHKKFAGNINRQITEQRKQRLNYIQKMYFKKVDNYLDKAAYGPTWLKEPKSAEKLVEKLFQYDGQYYDLIAYSIMSNHFHFLIDTYIQIKDATSDMPITLENYTPLEKMMQLIKGGSAYEMNKVLGRKGRLWQSESYDHIPRDEKEFYNIIRYIANNPVKTKLVDKWRDFPFTYVKPEYQTAFNS